MLARDVHQYSVALAGAHEARGRQLRTAVSSGTLIALDDCGAIPYLSGLPAIDLLGLTDAFIARHSPAGSAHYVLEERRPELIVLGEVDVERAGRRSRAVRFPLDFVIARAPAFAERYEPIGSWRFVSRRDHYELRLYARHDFRDIDRLRETGAPRP